MKSLQELAQDLEHNDPAERIRAIRAIASTRVPQAAPYLEKLLLKESDDKVIKYALKAMEGFRKLGLLDNDDGPIEPTVTMILSPEKAAAARKGNHHTPGGRAGTASKSASGQPAGSPAGSPPGPSSGPVLKNRAAIEKINSLLTDRASTVRAKAAMACIRLGDPATAPILRPRLLHEKDIEVRRAVILAYTTVADGQDLLTAARALAASKSSDDRKTLLEAIRASKRKDLLNIALGLLADSDSGVREAASRIIKAFGSATCLSILLEMAISTIAGERLDAARSMSMVPVRECIESLKTLFSDSESEVSKAAEKSLKLLAQKGNPLAMRALEEVGTPLTSPPGSNLKRDIMALTADEPSERIAAAVRISDSKDQNCLDIILQRLNQETEAEVLQPLIRAVGTIGSANCISQLKPFVESLNPALRASAVEALGQCGGNQALPLVALMIHDPDPSVRGRALVAIKPYPHIEINPFVKDMLHSDSISARIQAINVIRDLPDEELVEYLDCDPVAAVEKVFEDADILLREMAATAGSAPLRSHAEQIRNMLIKRRENLAHAPSGKGGTLADLGKKNAMARLQGLLHGPNLTETDFKTAASVKSSDSSAHIDPLKDIDPFDDIDPNDFKIGKGKSRTSSIDGISASMSDLESSLFEEDEISSSATDSAASSSSDRNSSQRDSAISSDTKKAAAKSSVTKSSGPGQVMKTIKNFDRASEDEKLFMIQQAAHNVNEVGFNLLRYALDSEERHIAGAAASAMGPYDGAESFKDYGMKRSGKSTVLTEQTPTETFERIEVQTIFYAGKKSASTLQDSLKEREKMFNVRSYWEGSFPRSQSMLNSLREDTQEMVTKALPDGEKPQSLFLLYHIDGLEEHIKGKKSLDSTQTMQQLCERTMTPPQNCPVMESLFAAVPRPAYLLAIMTRNHLTLFLRSNPGEKVSAGARIPVAQLTNPKLEYDSNTATLTLDRGSEKIILPDIFLDKAYEVEELFKGR
ncbi:MAG: hypothetical protein CVV64_17740 [Candidatus Wallbacteria bacterium HGW-Wallbacteria-1]|uniref:HEAT repeat domain-containing protein n=1 Tax=Candidatus Wallbacteria bacterium HGW-Wallbacteria-1 TaxID=2013854 RepID=A0A2N1PK22_9BACT|nr:MAG: hypothetical protein CVV64_17740 [Candidatus Wallbacteria bacterium HGW-Wallbacteria-1]